MKKPALPLIVFLALAAAASAAFLGGNSRVDAESLDAGRRVGRGKREEKSDRTASVTREMIRVIKE